MKKTNFFLNWNLIEKLKINMVYVRNWLWSKSLLKYVFIVQNYVLKYLPKLQLGLFVLYVSLFFIGIVCKIIPAIRFMLRLVSFFFIILYGIKHYALLLKHKNNFFLPIFYGKNASEEAVQFLLVLFLIFWSIIFLYSFDLSIQLFKFCVIGFFCFISWFVFSLGIFCFDENKKNVIFNKRLEEKKKLNAKLFILLKKTKKKNLNVIKYRKKSKYASRRF